MADAISLTEVDDSPTYLNQQPLLLAAEYKLDICVIVMVAITRTSALILATHLLYLDLLKLARTPTCDWSKC